MTVQLQKFLPVLQCILFPEDTFNDMTVRVCLSLCVCVFVFAEGRGGPPGTLESGLNEYRI